MWRGNIKKFGLPGKSTHVTVKFYIFIHIICVWNCITIFRTLSMIHFCVTLKTRLGEIYHKLIYISARKLCLLIPTFSLAHLILPFFYSFFWQWGRAETIERYRFICRKTYEKEINWEEFWDLIEEINVNCFAAYIFEIGRLYLNFES